MNNGSAMSALDAHIARVASIPTEFARIAALSAPRIRSIIASNISRGVAPDGTPWPATKDGRTPLRGAMGAVDVRAVGSTIVIAVDGVEALHHYGAVTGGKKRRLIPDGALSSEMIDAIGSVCDEVLAAHMAGR